MKNHQEQLGEILMGRGLEAVAVKKNRFISAIQNFVKSGVLFVAASLAPISGCEDGNFDSGNYADSTQGVKEADVENEPNDFQFPIFMVLGSEGLTMSGLTEEPITILVQIFDEKNEILQQQGFMCDGPCEGSIPIPNNTGKVRVHFQSLGGNTEVRSFDYQKMIEDSPSEAPEI